MKIFKNNRLSRRLLIYIFSCSTCLAILATIAQSFLVYQNDLQTIESNMRYIEKAYLPSIIQTVYNIDDTLLLTLLDSILNIQDIKYIETTAYLGNQKITTSRGNPAAPKDVTREFLLQMLAPYGKNLNLGTLNVYASYEGVYQRLWDTVFIILITNVIKALLAGVSIFFIFQFTLSRHLFRIARSVDKIGFNQQLDSPLTLDRRSYPDSSDELEQIVVAINDLCLRLSREKQNREIAEKQVREHEEKLRSLFNEAPDFILILDPKGVIDDANVKGIQSFGYTREECVGKKVLDIIAPQYREGMAEKLYEVLKGGKVRLYETVFVCKDDEKVYVEVNAEPQFIESKVIAIRAFVRDISSRKELEGRLVKQHAEFRAILNSITDAIVFVDLNRRIIMTNPGFKSIFGYDFEDVVGQTTQFFYANPEEYNKLGSQRYNKNSENSLPVYEINYRRKDGVIFPGETLGVPVKDKNNAVIGFLGVIRNISDKINARKEKENLEKRLVQAQKMEAIGTLAGGIAHDFNNILGAIIGYAEMAEEDSPAGSMAKEDIKQVLKASNRAKDLVKQILAFSRQAESEERVLQPALIIKEAMKMLRASLPTTIEIEQNIDPEAGLILADPTQIHQIITNLCTNAFHAMEETGGVLNIHLKNIELAMDDLVDKPHVQPGFFVEISVGDTGPGIAPEIMDKIFDPFFTTKEIGKGTGMGLAIIHGITKKSSGFVSCKSSPGEGTCFHVYFPVHAVTTPLEAETTAFELIQTGIERILFIDDEEILAEMGKTMLERLGYRVTVKTNSIEALKIIESQPDCFDLIITDQTMPGMTGSDLARRILQIRPGMPIILCTGFSNQISEEKARIYGIKGFAMKPLAKKDLAVLVRNVLEGESPGSC